jgi:hypothetical protein
MRTRTSASALLIAITAVAALATGCANGSSAGTAAGSGGGTVPSPTSGCPSTLSVTPTDGSKTLCVAVGGTVQVNLTSSDGTRWLPIEVNGTNLKPSGTPAAPSSPAPGAQQATYTAQSAGTAQITSSRPACPKTSGGMACNAIMAWKVTITVK